LTFDDDDVDEDSWFEGFEGSVEFTARRNKDRSACSKNFDANTLAIMLSRSDGEDETVRDEDNDKAEADDDGSDMSLVEMTEDGEAAEREG
jgi:hypothetical protein